MRYLIAILVFTAGNVVADTCTISGNTTTCSDGSRYMQHGSTITVTPGDRDMGGDVNVRYSGGAVDAGLRTIADVYGNQLRYDSEMYSQRMRDLEHRRALEQQESEFGRTYKLDQDRTAAQIRENDANIDARKREVELRGREVDGTLANQRLGLQQQNDQYYYGQTHESAAARALREDQKTLQERGNRDAQIDQNLGGLQTFIGGARDSVKAYGADPVKLDAQANTLLNGLAAQSPMAMETYFGGTRPESVRFARAGDGRYTALAQVGGKLMAYDTNGLLVPYDAKNPGAYRSGTLADYADIAETHAAMLGNSRSSGAAGKQRAEAISATAAADAAAVQAKPAVEVAANKAEQERQSAADALAAQQKARRDNALAKITESSNAAITDLNNQNRALTSGAPGGIGSALGLQSAAGITRQDEKDYRRVKQLPDDTPVTQGQIIEHAVRTQLPGVLQNPQMVGVLRQSGIAIPDGSFEDWTPEQQASVGGQVTRAMYGIVQRRGLRALHDGIDPGDIPTTAIQKPGTMPAPRPNVYRTDGLGSAVANWWENL